MQKKYCVIAAFFMAATVFGDNLTVVTEKIEVALEDYRKLGGSYVVRSEEQKRIIKLDKELAQEVQLFVCKLDAGEKKLLHDSPLLEFQEYTKNVSKRIRYGYYQNKTKKIFVNYRKFALGNGDHLYVCNNSLWNERKSESRINITTYAFFVSENGGGDISYLYDVSTYIDRSMNNAEMSDVFLGFIPDKTDNPPRIAFLTGPAGSGGFWKIIIYSYNQKENTWTASNVYENSGLSDFAYDETNLTFIYSQRSDKLEESKTLNLMELADKYCSRIQVEKTEE